MSAGTTTPGLRARDLRYLDELEAELDLNAELERWHPVRVRGPLDGPTLCLDDFSAIPFLDVAGAEEYQHRARVRALDGDLYSAVCPPCEGYEDYCRTLRLGSVELLQSRPKHGRMEVARACSAEPTFSALVDTARCHGGMRIHPYMGIEAVWELALELATASATTVQVLAPPPPVTWIANDKARLSDLVVALLGEEWIVETRRSADLDHLVRDLSALANRHAEVALKRLRCASGTGNKVFSSAWVRKAPSRLVREEIRKFLVHTEWDGIEEVLTVAWEQTDLSPSTQIWIPPASDGPPILDGIYEQILEGDEGTFVGSRPSRLPDALHLRLAEASLRVASGLQRFGYVGRCSFDHLVVGDPAGNCELRFTECNGRWGGTSIPMCLVDRLATGPRPPYRAQDVMLESLRGVRLADVLARLKGHLYDPSTGLGRFVLYNPGPLRDVGKIGIIAICETQDAAEEAMEQDLPALLAAGL